MGAGATGEEAVPAAGVAGDEDRGERLTGPGIAGDVGSAPREELEQELEIAAVGQADRRPALDGGRLAGQLCGVLALIDQHASPQAGANVVPPAVAEALEHLGGRAQLDDDAVLGLDGGDRGEAEALQVISELGLRLGLDA